MAQTTRRGLQAERTALSWSRAALLLIVNALLMLRSGWDSGAVSFTVVAVLLFLAAAATVGYGGLRRRQLLGGDGPVAPSAVATAVLAGVTFVGCAAGVASVVLGH
jgi:hypothetical protein